MVLLLGGDHSPHSCVCALSVSSALPHLVLLLLHWLSQLACHVKMAPEIEMPNNHWQASLPTYYYCPPPMLCLTWPNVTDGKNKPPVFLTHHEIIHCVHCR